MSVTQQLNMAVLSPHNIFCAFLQKGMTDLYECNAR